MNIQAPESDRAASDDYRRRGEISISATQIRAVAFSADGRFLVTGDKEVVRMWSIADGRQAGKPLETKDVRGIAVSRTGKWIAAGGSWGEMVVWEKIGDTFNERIRHNSDGHTVTSVDFSPDESQLVSASGNRRAYVWDVAASKTTQSTLTLQSTLTPQSTLEHDHWVIAAKFSPDGNHVATATFRRGIHIYNKHDGAFDKLSPIVVKPEGKDDSELANVTPYYNTGLLWSGRDIVIVSNKSIRRINFPFTSNSRPQDLSSVDDGNYPCIVSPESGKFFLYSDGYQIQKISFDRRPASSITLPECPSDLHAIALSPDGRFLAVGGPSPRDRDEPEKHKVDIYENLAIAGRGERQSRKAQISKEVQVASNLVKPRPGYF